MKRVVVTGLGLVSPLANGVHNSWERLISGQSGIAKLEGFDTDDLAVQIGGQVPTKIDDSIDEHSVFFNPNAYIEKREQKMMDKFCHFAMGAAHQAIQDSGWQAKTEYEQERTGVLIGSGIGGLETIYDTSVKMHERGPKRVSPYFIVSILSNMPSGHVAIKYGFKGPNHSCVSACATSTHAIGDAARIIMMGEADVMVTGGAEAALNRLGLAGFSACKALAHSYNDNPERASRPWDKHREGFVMGEGSGVLVLEEYEHAKKRGAKIYAEFVGYGMSGDAFHYTAPPEDGNGAHRAMKNALKFAKLKPESVDYINAHGTSTPLGDRAEVNAAKATFGDHAYKLTMSSTKSATGHLLGGAGGIEAVFSILSMLHGIIPPTLNLDNPDDGFDLNFAALKAQEKKIDIAMSNSFGFGGTNASLIFKKV
ncbi:MAG: beta-ketoacyl-[acyl-carrier-protein] synthase II [Alphaproteobacteria bacterium CG_4_10_14_0_8_um_filter_37_21]|nr:MAG: beta-ketoacyl-[acyl-carrier-protein] synthase II [Alphaproteobacteria bacterium CG_4_10_14_0_8_um_filter_37_21]